MRFLSSFCGQLRSQFKMLDFRDIPTLFLFDFGLGLGT